MAGKQNFIITDRVSFKIIKKKNKQEQNVNKKINILQNYKETKKDQ